MRKFQHIELLVLNAIDNQTVANGVFESSVHTEHAVICAPHANETAVFTLKDACFTLKEKSDPSESASCLFL